MPWTVPSSPRRPCSALNTQSKPPSRSTSHVVRSMSTPVTSAPRASTALPTSAPHSPLESPHHLALGLQLDVEPPANLGLNPFDEALHVGRRRAALVDDEVAVHGRDDRLSLARALEPGRLHEATRRVARRALEDAAAVLCLDLLRLTALPREPRHQRLGLLPIATLELDRRLDHQPALELSLAQGGGAVAELQVGRLPRRPAAARHEPFDLDKPLAQLLAPAAGVLIDRAPDGARNADCKLEPAQPGVGHDAREPHHLQPRAGSDRPAVDVVLAVYPPHDQS